MLTLRTSYSDVKSLSSQISFWISLTHGFGCSCSTQVNVVIPVCAPKWEGKNAEEVCFSESCLYLVVLGQPSGVTTMGSDRENPGAPNLNGPNGGPQA